MSTAIVSSYSVTCFSLSFFVLKKASNKNTDVQHSNIVENDNKNVSPETIEFFVGNYDLKRKIQ